MCFGIPAHYNWQKMMRKKIGCPFTGSLENPKPTTMNRPLYHSTHL
jgi:hypothetical protein